MENYFLLQNMNDTKLHESMDNENLVFKMTFIPNG